MANNKYITETWDEAVIRVPDIKKYEDRALINSVDNVFELVDSKPGYSLFYFNNGFFVFKADDVRTQVAKEGHD